MGKFLAAFAIYGSHASISAFVPSVPSHRGVASQSQSSSLTSLSMGLTLYGSPGSRSPLVDWAADELQISLTAGDLTKNPHPFGQIPCLVDEDNDATVFESGAILMHLLDVAATEMESSTKRRAAIMSWIVWSNASLDPICFLETPDGKVYDTGLKKPNKRIDALNEILSKQQFLLSDGFTIADVAVASYLLYVLQFFRGIDLSRWPHVVRYMKDCAGREGYGKAFGSNVQGFLLEALASMGGREKLFGMF
eukprot:CAMPEP_0172484378 /NCGR_PEP_ID=MMETSP1066-20121228/11822_1 /TAXON_ID=671091 /ORGANISM="Coscinodiscus wailesii, Strain CCMP2513" /LENGTH=250 /DNA_ID=CAMNT_0013248855 /DNA_START=112 /DNA_END=864 /DNA_ORIENTATION=-